LAEIVLSVSQELWEDIGFWVGHAPYDKSGRNDVVVWLSEQFKIGIPGGETVPAVLSPRRIGVEAVDVVNASWLALTDGTDKPVHRLAAKALDDLDFLGKWRAAGGQLADFRHDEEPTEVVGALSRDALLGRLNSPPPHGISVTPALPNSVAGASMDVRLGNHFIIFHQSSAAAFDALDETQDPRSMQYTIEKSWGETFYLHPSQLVLAATLEYIVVPADLTAQVATRSSYGRLGMLSATAVQVHPLFAGCLTLELVNLGEMPLVITPGERIAQLTFVRTSEPLVSPSDRKYRYPTGPEFSKIRVDEEGRVLRRMRANFALKRAVPGPATD